MLARLNPRTSATVGHRIELVVDTQRLHFFDLDDAPPSMTARSAVTADSDGGRFPEGFLWGVATSAYQIEGAVAEGGRGASIWDTFSHTPGRVRGGDTGDDACDHYHRFADDVALLADLGVRAYRFSVAWPRVQPSGRGPASQTGLDFYRRLVEALQAHGIEPVATLYHWDLPQALEDAGGWRSRDVAGRFADYAEVVGTALGGRRRPHVDHGQRADGSGLAGLRLRGPRPGWHQRTRRARGAHHLLLGHGLAAQALRATTTGDVGIALNLYPCRPADPEDPDDVEAADLADEQLNRLYLDPVFGRGYPRGSSSASPRTRPVVLP